MRRRPLATFDNSYDTFSPDKWKTIPEVIHELERHGKSASHLIRGMPAYVSNWKSLGLMEERERILSTKNLEKNHGLKIMEYRRKSTGTREELPYSQSPYHLLEGRLVVA